MEKCPHAVDYTKLFWLHDPFNRGIIRLDVQNEWVDIPRAWAMFKGEYFPREPVKFYQFMGSRTADFLWSGMIPLVCISEKVYDLLSSHKFVGWTTYPAIIYDKKGNQLPGYSGLTIKSDAGIQDLTRSPVITKPPITPKGKAYQVYKGMYFDEGKWDGSDVFLIQNGYIVITKAVRDVLVAEKVTNLRLVSLAEYEVDVNVISNLDR